MTLACFVVALIKSMTSLANTRFEILGPLQLVGNGLRVPYSTSDSICCDSFSMHATNRYGDNRSPCRIPREGVNFFVGSPLQRILIEHVETHCIITSTRCRGSCISSMVLQIKAHLSLSYAFFKSISIAIQTLLPFLAHMEYMTSWIMFILSPVWRRGTKLDCTGKINVGRIAFSLCTMHLDMNLYRTLQDQSV